MSKKYQLKKDNTYYYEDHLADKQLSLEEWREYPGVRLGALEEVNEEVEETMTQALSQLGQVVMAVLCVIAIRSVTLMSLWNVLVVYAFGCRSLSFVQSVGVLIFLAFLRANQSTKSGEKADLQRSPKELLERIKNTFKEGLVAIGFCWVFYLLVN